MLTEQFAQTMFLSILAAVSTMLGVLLMMKLGKWTSKNSIYFVSFSAGVVLTIAFIHLIPESLALSTQSLSVVLMTLIGFYSLEHVMVIHHCKEEDCEVHTLSSVAISGMMFHSLLDGFIIGVGFEASRVIGLAASAGVLLHKLPVGVSITSMLIHDRYKSRKTVITGLAIALATPLGALLSYFLFQNIAPSTLGLFLAGSAGSFIYIGASDLLPETHRNHRKSNIPIVILGVALMYLISYYFKH